MIAAVDPLASSMSSPSENFPLRMRERLGAAFGVACLALRKRGPFAALERGPWALWREVAQRWQRNVEAWPCQTELARSSGYSERQVRSHLATLALGGFLVVRYERRADGSAKAFYAPGSVTLAELAAWVTGDGSERARSTSEARAKPLPRVAHPPAMVAAAPPAMVAGEPVSTDKPTSFRSAVPKAVAPSSEEEEVAIAILGERLRRKYPREPRPCVDLRDVAVVVARVRELGSVEAARSRLTLALDGAWRRSEGPPSVSYTFGTLERLIDHAALGERYAKAQAKPERTATISRATSPAFAGEVAIPCPAEIAEELRRVFGGGAS